MKITLSTGTKYNSYIDLETVPVSEKTLEKLQARANQLSISEEAVVASAIRHYMDFLESEAD